MTLFALGPEGTFSHELACLVSPDNDILLLPSIGLVCRAVEEGKGDGIIPIENSEAGAVGPAMDALLRYRVFINAELYREVHHCLAAFLPLEQVTVVYAHPQSAEQCSEFLDTLGIAVQYTASNAASAVELVRNKSGAAIVSDHIASLYNVPIVKKNIENNQNNVTRFVKISASPSREETPEKCSIVVDPEEDRPGLLYDLLSVFARRKINLCRIESRPSRRGIGSYVFFMDITTNPGWQDGLREICGITQVNQLGCYRRMEVPR
jgi:prephenate dehydratase